MPGTPDLASGLHGTASGRNYMHFNRHHANFLYFKGVIPVHFLNIWLKYPAS